MPQFDKITFLTQIFWLFFIFLLLYLDLLKNFLSEISVILKIRKKKIACDSILVKDLNEKSFTTKSTKKSFIFNFSENIKNSVLDVSETSNLWLNDTLSNLNNSDLKMSHSKFLSSYFLAVKK